jgi:SAM-dependent methyltransferase
MKKDFAKLYGDLETWHWWFRGRRRIIESILRSELTVASKQILSVGCGPAEGLAWLLPFAGPEGKVVGLDIDPMHAQTLRNGVGFVVGSLQDAPLTDESFDVVLALDVLEHLDDDSRGLAEAVRLVKHGGLLLLTVPALPSLWGGQDVVSEHRRRYTKRSLVRLFRDAGLAQYRISYFNTLLFPVAAAVRLSRRSSGLGSRPRSDFEDNRPGLINDALAWVFGSESRLRNYLPMPIGVSLVATYRRSNAGGTSSPN